MYATNALIPTKAPIINAIVPLIVCSLYTGQDDDIRNTTRSLYMRIVGIVFVVPIFALWVIHVRGGDEPFGLMN